MTGFQLKLLAMLAMTADHIGAVFFPEIPLLRWIGRVAMPVLCFFIGEGLRHTRSPQRYLLRLTGFALLSELPFDLAFYSGIEWGHQNVYFTLALGLLALWAVQSRGMEGWLLALTAALAAELLGCDYGMYGVLLILLLDRFHRARSEQLAAAALLPAWLLPLPRRRCLPWRNPLSPRPLPRVPLLLLHGRWKTAPIRRSLIPTAACSMSMRPATARAR